MLVGLIRERYVKVEWITGATALKQMAEPANRSTS